METDMPAYEAHQGNYTLSTDKARLDLEAIYLFLNQTAYWAKGRSLEMVKKSIENSLCFGIYDVDGHQVGFARVVTDFAAFAWVCDVFILEEYRGKGLGKWLVQSLVEHPELKSLKRILLVTTDAHELYRQYGGFKPLAEPVKWMELVRIPAVKRQE
jgi:GNAT superfamily N-acetyltransferase